MFKQSAKNHYRCGQSLTEFAITLPFLLLLLVGVLDLGRAYFAYMTVVNASREGARYGAENPDGYLDQASLNSAVVTRAKNEAQGSIINPSQLNVDLSNEYPSGCSGGNPFQVRVSYNFQLVTTLIFGGGTIPVQNAAQMAVFGQCPVR